MYLVDYSSQTVWLGKRNLGAIVTGIRAKIVLLLVVFFAGVATGVYLAVPAQGEVRGRVDGTEASLLEEAFRSDKAALSLRSGMDQCLKAGRAASISVAKAIESRIFERDAVVSAETSGQ